MSPRTEEENFRVRETQKQRIRQIATTVFARQGLAAAKISDIAAAAEVSYGLVYHYFKSKEELFALLVEDAMQGTLQLFQEAEQRPGTPWERLLWLIEQTLQGIREHPEASMLILQANTSEATPSELRLKLAQLNTTTTACCQRIVSEGQACGQFIQGDAYNLTLILMACLHGFSAGTTFLNPLYKTFPSAEELMRIFKAY